MLICQIGRKHGYQEDTHQVAAHSTGINAGVLAYLDAVAFYEFFEDGPLRRGTVLPEPAREQLQHFAVSPLAAGPAKRSQEGLGDRAGRARQVSETLFPSEGADL